MVSSLAYWLTPGTRAMGSRRTTKAWVPTGVLNNGCWLLGEPIALWSEMLRVARNLTHRSVHRGSSSTIQLPSLVCVACVVDINLESSVLHQLLLLLLGHLSCLKIHDRSLSIVFNDLILHLTRSVGRLTIKLLWVLAVRLIHVWVLILVLVVLRLIVVLLLLLH